MKFETGLEQKDRAEVEAKGGKLSWFQKYKRWNWKMVPELLKMRKENQKQEEERLKARIEELKRREKNGELYAELLGDPKDEETSTKN